MVVGSLPGRSLQDFPKPRGCGEEKSPRRDLRMAGPGDASVTTGAGLTQPGPGGHLPRLGMSLRVLWMSNRSLPFPPAPGASGAQGITRPGRLLTQAAGVALPARELHGGPRGQGYLLLQPQGKRAISWDPPIFNPVCSQRFIPF